MYRVIIADDESVIRNGIVHLVDWNALNCSVVFECSNGQEVLNYIQNNPADIVISDIKMPGMDGITLIKELQQDYPEIKTVILTVYNEFDYAQKALRYGAADFIVKNDFISELPKTIDSLIKRIEKQKNDAGQLEQTHELVLQDYNNVKAYILESVALSKVMPVPNGIQKYGLDRKTYCACTCEITYTEKQPEKWDMVKTLGNFLNITLNRYEHYLIDVKKDSMAVVICSDKAQGLSLKDVAIAINNVLRIVEEFMRIQMKFGISQVVGDVTELQKAYEQSKEALFRIASPGNKVLIYTEDGDKKNHQTSLSKFGNIIVGHLCSKEFDKAMLALEDMKQAASLSQLPLATKKVIFLNMCSALFRKIEESYLWEEAQKTEIELYNDISSSTTIYTMFKLCENLLLTLEGIMNQNRMEKHYIVNAINQYIEDHFASNITLQDISEKLHISPSYVSRLYKKKTGMTVTNAINQLRVQKSKVLLRDTALKIYEVAQMVGIEDAGYFTNMFMKYEGCSPSKYRGNQST